MDKVDREILRNESDASPDPFPRVLPRDSAEIERVPTTSTTSSIDSKAPSRRIPVSMSRMSTQTDVERHPTVAQRVHTARLQHVSTVGRTETGTSRRDEARPYPTMGLGKQYPPSLPEREDYVVEFDGPDDPLHAQNWSMKKKLYLGAILAYTSIVSVFTSSIFSPSLQSISTKYFISLEVSTLGVSLFVFGFAVGPSIWAPLSELYGRKLPLVIAMFGFSIFEVGVASAANIQTIMLCRFFAGAFGACPLAVVAAVFSDIFDTKTRGLAVTVFAMTVFTGPLMAPFIGGFIDASYLGWRWTQWIPAFMGFSSFALCLLIFEESYAPIILVSKAAELRRRTLNWGIHAKQEEIEVDFRELVQKNLTRPIRLLMEPILLAITVYMSFIYGILYLMLAAYPIIFQGEYGMRPGISGLPYFGMIVGMFGAGGYIVFVQKSWARKLEANNGVTVPEWRLPPVIVGGVTFTLGLFWLGWSGYTGKVHWIVPTLSGLLTGFGILAIFIQCLNYLVDTYLMFAASAIAANTLLRSAAGGAFPLFARQMFNNLGIEWACTLLGCLALIMIPIPALFYRYGHLLRNKSKFAPTKPMPPSNGDEKETFEVTERDEEKVDSRKNAEDMV